MTGSRAAAIALTAVLAAGCGSGSTGSATVGATTTHHLDERANGKTIDAQLGDTVVVVLHSTYWTFPTPPAVLQPVGAPQVSASPCAVPGSGCGTVTASYNATHVGTVLLRAHRDSCGEALRCTGKAADWSVTVHVG